MEVRFHSCDSSLKLLQGGLGSADRQGSKTLGTEALRLLNWHCSDMLLGNLRPSTIKARRNCIGRLVRFSENDLLLELGPRDLSAFLSRPLMPESRAMETTHIRQFYEWCVDVELLDVSPARRLRRPRVPRRVPRPMSEEDLAMAVSLAPARRIRPWLLLGSFAGLRACEMAQLRADDIWWGHDPALIIISEGKGGHASTVAMSPDLARYLQTCELPMSGWLFPRRDGQDGAVPAHLVSQLCNLFLHELGLDATLHSTRHRFGTEIMKSAGGNIRVAQEGLRHESIRSTQLYTFVAPTEVAAAVAGLPRLLTDDIEVAV